MEAGRFLNENNEKLLRLSLNEFSIRLASDSPTPGGGSAAAYAACMGASLISMASEIILKKEQAPDRTAKLKAISKRAEELRMICAGLVEADAKAYAPVAKAYALPKQTAEEERSRSAAIQEALKMASQTPLGTVEACVDLLGLTGRIASFGESSIISDIETAIHLGYCALHSAAGNVRINLHGIKDPRYVQSRLEKLDKMMREASDIYERTLSDVRARARLQ